MALQIPWWCSSMLEPVIMQTLLIHSYWTQGCSHWLLSLESPTLPSWVWRGWLQSCFCCQAGVISQRTLSDSQPWPDNLVFHVQRDWPQFSATVFLVFHGSWVVLLFEHFCTCYRFCTWISCLLSVGSFRARTGHPGLCVYTFQCLDDCCEFD